MKKRIVLLIALTCATLFLSGCGHRGYWGGHGHSHNSDHAHYAGCGHRGY